MMICTGQARLSGQRLSFPRCSRPKTNRNPPGADCGPRTCEVAPKEDRKSAWRETYKEASRFQSQFRVSGRAQSHATVRRGQYRPRYRNHHHGDQLADAQMAEVERVVVAAKEFHDEAQNAVPQYV